MNLKLVTNKILIIFVVVLVGVAGYFILPNSTSSPQPIHDSSLTPISTPTSTPNSIPAPKNSASPLQICPEEWYVNRMPSIIGSNDITNEYFVYKDVRRELSEFDVEWVKINCPVKPQTVY